MILESGGSFDSDEDRERGVSQPAHPHTPLHAPNHPAFSGDGNFLRLSSSDSSSSPVGFAGLVVYDKVARATRDILTSSADEHTMEALWSLAQKHLLVFEMERYAGLDTPNWVRRAISDHAARMPVPRVYKTLTVRKLVSAMYTTAEDLGLEKGKRYVAAAVCACAIYANTMDAGDESKNEALAVALQTLASTWAAYLLWPCA